MTGYLWAALGFLAALGMTTLGDMASEEVRDRLDHLPHAILGLAARRLSPGQRVTIYEEEWLPELTYILKGAETRPITRLITGAWYALGILISAGFISDRLDRSHATQAIITINYDQILDDEYTKHMARAQQLIREAEKQRKRDMGKGRSTLHTKSVPPPKFPPAQ